MSIAPRLYGAQLRWPTMATTKTIDIRTAIPGPRSQAILERKQRVIANAKSIVLPVVAQEGRGATLTDVDGNVFIDFTGGVGCLNTGHSHPRVVEAATEQLGRFATPTSPSSPTSRTSSWPSACSRGRRSRARPRQRSSTPAPRPSRTRSSSRGSRPSGPP